jgi:hypothetical protein
VPGNTRFFNKWLYIQRYYDIYDEAHFWRFWILGFYFDTEKYKNSYTTINKDMSKQEIFDLFLKHPNAQDFHSAINKIVWEWHDKGEVKTNEQG